MNALCQKALAENSYHCAGCCMWNTLSVIIQVSITVDQAKKGKLSFLAVFPVVISSFSPFFSIINFAFGGIAGRSSSCAQQQNYVIFLEVFFK